MESFDRTGIILYVLEYEKCIHFYKDILELKVMFSTESLMCFEFGEAYLMVEIDDECDEKKATKEGRIRTCLRMNVSDVTAYANKLKAKSIEVDYQEHSWGIVAKFFDPDGNLLAFKDSKSVFKN